MSLPKPSFFEWRASGLHVLLLVCFVKAAVLNGFGNFCWLCWKPSFPFEDLIQKKQWSLLCVAWEFIWKLFPDGLALNQGICVGLAGPSNPIWNWHSHSGASPDSLVACVSFYLKHPVEQSFPLISLKHENNWQVTNHLSLKLIMDTVRHRESFPVAPGPGPDTRPAGDRAGNESFYVHFKNMCGLTPAFTEELIHDAAMICHSWEMAEPLTYFPVSSSETSST